MRLMQEKILQLVYQTMEEINQKLGTDFSKDKIEIAFFTPATGVSVYEKLCERYFPKHLTQEYKQKGYFETFAAMAFIGEEKDGILIREDIDLSPFEWHHMILHEFSHIIVCREEFNGEMFYDKYCVDYADNTSDMQSMSTSLSNAYSQELTTSLNAGLEDLVESGIDTKFSFEAATNSTAGSYADRFFATTRGGSAFSAISMDGFKSAFTSWQNSIERNPALIGVTSDGLVPLWDLLPSEYDTSTNRAKIRNLYLAYAENYSVDYSQYNHSLESQIDIGTFNVRTGEKTITDAGRFVHNIYDPVEFNSKSKYGISVLKNMGYSRMSITINLDMKEVDKGYQYIFIYNGSASDDTLLEEKQIELGGTNKQSTYINKVYTFDIPLDALDLKNPHIVIRYGASGSNEDNWCNKNVKMSISFY